MISPDINVQVKWLYQESSSLFFHSLCEGLCFRTI